MKLIKYIFIILIFSSCTINQYTRFLQDSKRLPQYAKEEMQRYRIQVDDELQVKILSLNKEVTSIFNSNSRYRVYTDGTIDLPFIDSIKVSGLTLPEAKIKIESMMKDFIIDADVVVALANNYFYVLGDAGKGSFQLYKEKITIYQAIALCGGMQKIGSRKNVYILRKDSTGHTNVIEFDIRPISVIDSEYYYIQPNDIIYVPPVSERFFKMDSFMAIVGVVSTSFSLFFLIYGLTKK